MHYDLSKRRKLLAEGRRFASLRTGILSNITAKLKIWQRSIQPANIYLLTQLCPSVQ
jgi:hypothetical protein